MSRLLRLKVSPSCRHALVASVRQTGPHHYSRNWLGAPGAQRRAQECRSATNCSRKRPRLAGGIPIAVEVGSGNGLQAEARR